MNISELCVWECQGTIRDTLPALRWSELTLNHQTWNRLDSFFCYKKNESVTAK